MGAPTRFPSSRSSSRGSTAPPCTTPTSPTAPLPPARRRKWLWQKRLRRSTLWRPRTTHPAQKPRLRPTAGHACSLTPEARHSWPCWLPPCLACGLQKRRAAVALADRALTIHERRAGKGSTASMWLPVNFCQNQDKDSPSTFCTNISHALEKKSKKKKTPPKKKKKKKKKK